MTIENDSIRLAGETGVTVAVAAHALYYYDNYDKAKKALVAQSVAKDSYDLNKSDSD